MMTSDQSHMARALQLARRGLYTAHPNPRVGCVLVRDGEIVGEGWHQVTGGPHAEIHALRAAGERAAGSTAYVTLEPCCHHGRTPPCTDALVAAGVARVVFGSGDPNPAVAGGGQRQLAEAGIEVVGGVLQADCDALNPGFARRMGTGRPLVRSKIAASLDGRTALASGESQWITGPAARTDVQHLRARSGAILTGAGTIVADDPALNVRLDLGPEFRQPVRVIADSSLRVPPTARLLGLPGETLILHAGGADAAAAALVAAGARVERLPGEAGRVALSALLDRLGQLEINEVLVEAGRVLNGALLAADLVDELVVYQAPHVLGDTARGMFALALEAMAERRTLRLADLRRVGDDLRLTYTRA